MAGGYVFLEERYGNSPPYRSCYWSDDGTVNGVLTRANHVDGGAGGTDPALLQAIRDRLPDDLGAQAAAESLSVVFATDATNVSRSDVQTLATTMHNDLSAIVAKIDTAPIPAGTAVIGYVKQRGSSDYATGQVTVGATPVMIVAARPTRSKLVLSPTTAAAFYVGGPGVSSTTGMFIGSGGTVNMETAAAVYAVAASSSFTLSYVEYWA
jgi:hypothetical protein